MIGALRVKENLVGDNSNKEKMLLRTWGLFSPVQVDPILKSYLTQRSKQEFMHVNRALFSEKKL